MQVPDAVYTAFAQTCSHAWEKGLLAGFNGNVSIKDGAFCYVTQSGAAKGYLQRAHIAKVCLADGRVVFGKPSSELAMHLASYRAVPEAGCLVHTHPRHMLALGLVVTPEAFLRVPLFEAEYLRSQLGIVAAYAPGTQELADAVAASHKQNKAVWMAQHGLSVWGQTLTEALALSEELEHMAAIQLLSM